ncbi:ABC transporter ATP-binding protein, partial [Thermodesulfobacteriota bacterium]
MGNSAIIAQGIGKRYHIGRVQKYKALRDSISDVVKAPLRWLKSKDDNSREDEIFWALKDISFKINQGDAVAVIGRNGAGKSTLLKILSRISDPTEGFADIYGRVGSLLEVGTGFHPELTGRENIFLNGAILGMSHKEIKQKFDEMVHFAEVERFIDTPVKHYSSGMYVRLAFSVAAHFEPEILLVDEVLAVGDAEFQKKCMGKMEDISQQGRTVLFVSHNMMAVKNLCTKGIVLNGGKLVCHDEISKAVEEYLTGHQEYSGEVSWDNQETAPGNPQVRLKAVRIISEGQVTGSPFHSKDIEVQIDYWNLEKDSRRLLSIHV